MENDDRNKKNDELFTKLKEYPEDSKEYPKIVTEIIINNQRLVTYFANKYFPFTKSTTISSDDLIQEGYFGLLKAVKSFKLEKGVTFATYAVHQIKGYILNHLRQEIRNMADSLEVNKNGDTRELKDTIAAPLDQKDDIVEQDEAERKLAWVKKNLDRLKPFQRKVLSKKYLSGKAILTDDALAKHFKRSRQTIVRNKDHAIENLKKIYYKSHPEEKEIELTSEEKIKMQEVLKNLILTKLAPRQKDVMLCKFYSANHKTIKQVAQEINLTENVVGIDIYKASKKLCTLCGSIKDKKHLKSILEFRNEENAKER